MSVFNLSIITKHASSYRQTSIVLSQCSRSARGKADQTIGEAPILSNHVFELVRKGFLNLSATMLSEPSFSHRIPWTLAYFCFELILVYILVLERFNGIPSVGRKVYADRFRDHLLLVHHPPRRF